MINWENVDHQRYDEFITNIIQTRGQWNMPEGEYWEGHHIIPRCAGGKGSTKRKEENIIWLFAREHFIAHKILAEDNPNNYSLVSAYGNMAWCHSSDQERYELNPEEYEEAKVMFAIVQSVEHTDFKADWTDERKDEYYDKWKSSIDARTEEQHIESVNKLRKTLSKKDPAEIHASHIKGADKVRGKKYYNNGTEQHRYYVGEQPEGWVKGKLPLSEESEMHRKESYYNAFNSKSEEELSEILERDILNNSRTKPVQCINNNEIFVSGGQAAKKYGFTPYQIQKCIVKNEPDKNGNYWKIISKEEYKKLKDLN